MRLRKRKLEPFFGDVMDVYYILEGGQRVLMGRTRPDGNPPCVGMFTIETNSKGEKILVLPPVHRGATKKDRIRVVYYAQTVYQLDIPIGTTKVPLKIDRR